MDTEQARTFLTVIATGNFVAAASTSVSCTPRKIVPGFGSKSFFEERLILVSTNPKSLPEPGPDYVYVDWGPEFYNKHSASFPGFKGASLTVNIGWLGLQAHAGSRWVRLFSGARCRTADRGGTYSCGIWCSGIPNTSLCCLGPRATKKRSCRHFY